MKTAMAKPITRFICQDCGATHKKWAGRCDACGAWNTIVEEAPLSQGPGRGLGAAKGKAVPLTPLSPEHHETVRRALAGAGLLA